MKIGILQTGHVSDKMISATGDYGEIFRRFLHHDGVEFDTYSVVDMDFPSSADAAQGWLITGSKHGAYDPLPFIPKLEALVREIYQRRQPLVGICFSATRSLHKPLGDVLKSFLEAGPLGIRATL